VKKLARTVYLALDADAAGVRATLKGLQALQSQPEGELTAVTSPHGVIGLQRQQDVEIRILTLPEGKDPTKSFRKTRTGGVLRWQLRARRWISTLKH
jgi:DNA primase